MGHLMVEYYSDLTCEFKIRHAKATEKSGKTMELSGNGRKCPRQAVTG
jgi:hypothetical protein